MPTSIDAENARLAFRRYLESTGSSANAFAKSHNLTQSTVQRFLVGRNKRLTKAAREILHHANIASHFGITTPRHNERLELALARAWDGKLETVDLLARLIEALGAALRDKPHR